MIKMTEYDYVIQEFSPLQISQEAVFNIADLYKHTKAWFDFHGYDFYEKEYHDIAKEDSKDMIIKWKTEKKIDDYLRMVIKITIRCNNITNVKTKKGMANKGKVIFKFVAYMEKDYDNKWSGNFFSQFTREVYDRFIITNQINTRMNDLKNEVYEVYNEVKSFLALHKYKG